MTRATGLLRNSVITTKCHRRFLSLNLDISDTIPTRYDPNVVIDCANGVGSVKMAQMVDFVNTKLNVKLVNSGEGKLNCDCGADFVKLYRTKPVGMDLMPNKRAASFDGDADRLVYYFIDDSNSFQLLDGDKIALLYVFLFEAAFEKIWIRRQVESADDTDSICQWQLNKLLRRKTSSKDRLCTNRGKAFALKGERF